MNTQSKILLGVLGAFAAGTVLGMLIAPEKGSDLRDRITKAAGELSEEIMSMVASGRSKLEDLAEEGKDVADTVRSEAESKLVEKINETAS